jgi:hypothetical protein
MSDVMTPTSGFEIDLTEDDDEPIPDTEPAPFGPCGPYGAAQRPANSISKNSISKISDDPLETGLPFSVVDWAS